MFINNPTSIRGASILANNENAATEQQFRHPKLSSNEMKKASFHDNAETPHRNNKNAISKAKGGQTTQRRRRAFGDISNRKLSGGGGGASGGGDSSVVLKRTSSSNLAQNTINKPTTANLTNSSKVQYPPLPPSAPSTLTNNAQSGIKSGANSSLRKPLQHSYSNVNTSSKITSAGERDDVFPSTSRWADNEAIVDDTRSPFYLVSNEEWNMISDLREEFSKSTQKESEERIRLEIERDEQLFMEKVRDINDGALATITPTSNVDGLSGMFDGLQLLEDKLPWEVNDGGFDPTEERRLSGNDPCSLWGDISNW